MDLPFISAYATVCQASTFLLPVDQKAAAAWYCNPRKELVNTGGKGEGWKKCIAALDLQALSE